MPKSDLSTEHPGGSSKPSKDAKKGDGGKVKKNDIEKSDKQRKEEVDKQKKDEDKKNKEDIDKKKKEDVDKKKKEAADKKKNEEAEKKKKKEADKKHKEEADNKKKDKTDKKHEEEADKKKKKEADKQHKEDVDKKKKSKADKKHEEEAEKKNKKEADKKHKEEADKKKNDEAKKKNTAEVDKTGTEEANKKAAEGSKKKDEEKGDKAKDAVNKACCNPACIGCWIVLFVGLVLTLHFSLSLCTGSVLLGGRVKDGNLEVGVVLVLFYLVYVMMCCLLCMCFIKSNAQSKGLTIFKNILLILHIVLGVTFATVVYQFKRKTRLLPAEASCLAKGAAYIVIMLILGLIPYVLCTLAFRKALGRTVPERPNRLGLYGNPITSFGPGLLPSYVNDPTDWAGSNKYCSCKDNSYSVFVGFGSVDPIINLVPGPCC